MKITLSTVRQVLKGALGFDSFTAGFIRNIEEAEWCPTSAINKEGTLVYNPAFVEKYIASQEDLFTLIFHETLHIVFQSFIYDCGPIENLAADAIINAVISQLYSEESGGGNFFRKIYRNEGIEGLLRPGSRMQSSRFDRLYQALYNSWRRESLTTGEMIQTLKILLHGESFNILLLGGHFLKGEKGGEQATPEVQPVDRETAGRIAEDIKKNIAGGRDAGYYPTISELLMEALESRLSIRRALLLSYTTEKKLDRFKEEFRQKHSIVSPIPLYPSKKDLVLLASGLLPVYFHNKLNRPRQKNHGLAIYLDVSGSVNDSLPEILGILRRLQREVTSVYQFSNEVVETSMRELTRGRIATTYGTSFDVVAKSILENAYRKAVVITDGFSNIEAELQKQMKGKGVKILTILFGGASERNDFVQFGEVIHLKNAVG
jgi:hypothetical protein